mmetsp:Transcript_344/g.908  ORF Transcript_344/g.908 Transcript_344/m.908 type:complete len:498 (-) Transcript_344:2792-4285(-)
MSSTECELSGSTQHARQARARCPLHMRSLLTTPILRQADCNAPLCTINAQGLSSSRFLISDKKQLAFRDEAGRINLNMVLDCVRQVQTGKVVANQALREKLYKWERHVSRWHQNNGVTWRREVSTAGTVLPTPCACPHRPSSEYCSDADVAVVKQFLLALGDVTWVSSKGDRRPEVTKPTDGELGLMNQRSDSCAPKIASRLDDAAKAERRKALEALVNQRKGTDLPVTSKRERSASREVPDHDLNVSVSSHMKAFSSKRPKTAVLDSDEDTCEVSANEGSDKDDNKHGSPAEKEKEEDGELDKVCRVRAQHYACTPIVPTHWRLAVQCIGTRTGILRHEVLCKFFTRLPAYKKCIMTSQVIDKCEVVASQIRERLAPLLEQTIDVNTGKNNGGTVGVLMPDKSTGMAQPRLLSQELSMLPHQLVGLSWLYGLRQGCCVSARDIRRSSNTLTMHAVSASIKPTAYTSAPYPHKSSTGPAGFLLMTWASARLSKPLRS